MPVLCPAPSGGEDLGMSDAIDDDLDDLVGTWVEDDAFDDAVAAFRSVNAALWR